MAKLNSLCVYCGANEGGDPEHRSAAVRFGKMMADQDIGLVFGGGRIGLMGVIADTVMNAGGRAIGVIPEHLHDIEVGHEGLTELHIVNSMHTRKQLMFDLSDAFVVLPGGLGTLDETFEIITWRQLGLHDKPVILVDNNGYWQPFNQLVQHVIDNGFARASSVDLFTIVNSTDDIIPTIKAAPEQQISPKSSML